MGSGLVQQFFRHSELLDLLALRQLAHVRCNWELTWDDNLQRYEPEDESFAEKVNELVNELSRIEPPSKYHDHEDRLAECLVGRLGWNIRKVGTRWEGADYPFVLEQGAFDYALRRELLLAAAGRITAALNRGQFHFDDMEEFHRKMLADVLAVILYHRAN